MSKRRASKSSLDARREDRDSSSVKDRSAQPEQASATNDSNRIADLGVRNDSQPRKNEKRKPQPWGLALNILATGIVLALAITFGRMSIGLWHDQRTEELAEKFAADRQGIPDLNLEDWTEVKLSGGSFERRRFVGAEADALHELQQRSIVVASQVLANENVRFDPASLNGKDRRLLMQLAKTTPLAQDGGRLSVYLIDGPNPLVVTVRTQAIEWVKKQVNDSDVLKPSEDDKEKQPNVSAISQAVVCWALAFPLSEKHLSRNENSETGSLPAPANSQPFHIRSFEQQTQIGRIAPNKATPENWGFSVRVKHDIDQSTRLAKRSRISSQLVFKHRRDVGQLLQVAKRQRFDSPDFDCRFISNKPIGVDGVELAVVSPADSKSSWTRSAVRIVGTKRSSLKQRHAFEKVLEVSGRNKQQSDRNTASPSPAAGSEQNEDGNEQVWTLFVIVASKQKQNESTKFVTAELPISKSESIRLPEETRVYLQFSSQTNHGNGETNLPLASELIGPSINGGAARQQMSVLGFESRLAPNQFKTELLGEFARVGWKTNAIEDVSQGWSITSSDGDRASITILLFSTEDGSSTGTACLTY